MINLLLRSYLAHNQYDQADKLISKSTFQGQVNQAQSVRWLFYAGRLRAVQLNYSLAKTYLQGAIARAPKDEVAPGFVQIVSRGVSRKNSSDQRSDPQVLHHRGAPHGCDSGSRDVPQTRTPSGAPPLLPDRPGSVN